MIRRLSTKSSESFSWAPYAVVGVVGSLVAWFWRASQAQTNRLAALTLADQQSLDPKEREELRSNALKTSTFADVARTAVPGYANFVQGAMPYLDKPLEHGHYIDRVVLTQKDESRGFLLAALGLALEDKADLALITGDCTREEAAKLLEWVTMAGHVAPSKLVTEADESFPVQKYKLKTPLELLDCSDDVLTQTQIAAILSSLLN